MLRFDGVCFDFAGRSVLNEFDLEVATGKLVVVLGRSGCGKTTMLRLAAGLLQPDRGRLLNTFEQTASVFQEPRLLPWASALDNAALGLKARGMPAEERRKRITEILLTYGLKRSDLGKLPGELSGGMAQRVALARAMSINPRLVLMDEPFGALDAGLRRQLQDTLRGEVDKAGTTVLFVTHDVTEAVRLADRIIVLSGSPAGVAADIEHIPLKTQADIYDGSAMLLRHREIGQAFSLPV